MQAVVQSVVLPLRVRQLHFSSSPPIFHVVHTCSLQLHFFLGCHDFVLELLAELSGHNGGLQRITAALVSRNASSFQTVHLLYPLTQLLPELFIFSVAHLSGRQLRPCLLAVLLQHRNFSPQLPASLVSVLEATVLPLLLLLRLLKPLPLEDVQLMGTSELAKKATALAQLALKLCVQLLRQGPRYEELITALDDVLGCKVYLLTLLLLPATSCRQHPQTLADIYFRSVQDFSQFLTLLLCTSPSFTAILGLLRNEIVLVI
mmetsp:Transcript_29842/g.75079  ORF Transcript_29842/g.75079 Transcript_29842/m.75079 type:complete len:261 (+) Transcript_29842:336-1118(+)